MALADVSLPCKQPLPYEYGPSRLGNEGVERQWRRLRVRVQLHDRAAILALQQQLCKGRRQLVAAHLRTEGIVPTQQRPHRTSVALLNMLCTKTRPIRVAQQLLLLPNRAPWLQHIDLDVSTPGTA